MTPPGSAPSQRALRTSFLLGAFTGGAFALAVIYRQLA